MLHPLPSAVPPLPDASAAPAPEPPAAVVGPPPDAPLHASPDAPLSPPLSASGVESLDSDVGGRLFGRYRVVRAVGVGGFARVYHAVDPDLELDVAVKVLRPELAHDAEVVERFRREAMTAAKLRHPHVITVLTVGRLAEPFDGIPAGAPYLVMDFLPESLADRVGDGGTLPERDVARVGAEVARGLAYAHRQGIVHRDVKPENVLFARDGRAVVTDFGIARALSAAPSGPSRQVLLGTPAYFSPEQARGLPLDGRSDLYALGVALYRAATGVVPFAGDDWYVVMRQHVEEVAPPPSSLHAEIGPGFDGVLARALAKDPAARYPTGDAMADALDALRGAGGDRPHTTEIPRVPAGAVAQARRWRTAGAGLAAAAVAIVGGRLLAVRGTPERVPARQALAAERPALPPAAGAPANASSVQLARGDSTAPNARARTGIAGSNGRAGVTPESAVVGANAASLTAGLDATAKSAASRAAAKLPRAAAAARVSGTATLVVNAPADADIYLDDELVGHGSFHSAPISAGHYVVRATLGGLPGCASADASAAVDIGAGARRSVSLQPVACGRLLLEFAASNTPHYRLEPIGGGPAHEGILPLPQGLVLPDGSYRLTVQAGACADFHADIVPVVAGRTRREAGALICP